MAFLGHSGSTSLFSHSIGVQGLLICHRPISYVSNVAISLFLLLKHAVHAGIVWSWLSSWFSQDVPCSYSLWNYMEFLSSLSMSHPTVVERQAQGPFSDYFYSHSQPNKCFSNMGQIVFDICYEGQKYNVLNPVGFRKVNPSGSNLCISNYFFH